MTQFYGLGIGPGDPELITLKAFRILEKADYIIAPKARIKSDSLARNIVEELFDEEKEFIELEFPMTKNQVELDKRYKNAANLIMEKIEQGKSVAYLTIGDPLLYSTYIYLLNALNIRAPELEIKTVPGIAAYSALASRANFSLAEKDERVCICPVPSSMEELEKIITENDTTVIMKVAKKLPHVIALLQKMKLHKYTIFGSHVGMDTEKVIDGRLEEFVLNEKEGYLSTIIVRKK